MTFACYADRIRTCSSACKRALPTLRANQRLEAETARHPHGMPDRTPRSATKSATRLKRHCIVCGEGFLVAPAVAGAYATCSRECSSANKRLRNRGTALNKCKQCESEFTVNVSAVKGMRTGEYCSNECRISALNELPRPPAQMADCRICGNEFRRPKGHSRPDSDGKTRGIYCSRRCMWLDDDYRKRRAAKHSPTCLERWLFTVLDEAGIPYEKFATVGRYVPDALLVGHNVIIEVDGVVWHRERIDYDRQRDVDLATAGYVVMHFTDLELTGIKKARALIGAALVDISHGQARYRPPLLFRPGTPSRPLRSDLAPRQDM